MRKQNDGAAIDDYWMEHFLDKESKICTLCGNSGEIDTRATAISATGVRAGRLNYCICPNGRRKRLADKKA